MDDMERAAAEYAKGIPYYQDRKGNCAEDFMAGARWAVKALAGRNEGDTQVMDLSVARDFSRRTGMGREADGMCSGELFRERFLSPMVREAIRENKLLRVSLDGTAGLAQSFLEEAFGGLIREGIPYWDVIRHVRVISDNDLSLIDDIDGYMDVARSLLA